MYLQQLWIFPFRGFSFRTTAVLLLSGMCVHNTWRRCHTKEPNALDDTNQPSNQYIQSHLLGGGGRNAAALAIAALLYVPSLIKQVHAVRFMSSWGPFTMNFLSESLCTIPESKFPACCLRVL
ncbi:hypothetical protein I79_019560 [Cricetulus griseus]|uniref:Uncharacterized protein n=2 Tax=Cricetulus griseus TaxID=10029 RepID=G3I7R3_CRIGR|nr:hypothetical protein I79_019560 [Cricetulus griseus]